MGVSRRDLLMVAVLLSGTLLAVLNQTFLSPALPTIMADLNVSATTAQWLTSGYSLTEAVIIPLSAFFMGRFKTRNLFACGMGLFAIGSGLCAIAPNFQVMLLGRIFQAACTGSVMPMVTTVILLVFPREKRGTAMGMIGLIIGFAPAVGPSTAGLLIDSVGWRVLFVIVFALAVLVIVLSLVFLKNFADFEKVSFDFPSVLLSSSGLICLLYGLSSFSSGSIPELTAVLIVAGIVLIVLFANRQLKLEQPMLRVDVLKTPTYRKAVCTIFLMQLCLVGIGLLMPLYIQGTLGQSATTSGLVMLPGAIAGALFGLVAGTLFDRFGARRVAVPVSFVMVAGGAGMLMLSENSPVAVVTIVYTVLTLGLQASMNPINTWGLNSLDNSVLQHAQGLSNALNQVAASFGTALLVSLSALGPAIKPEAPALEQTFAGYHLAFIATACILVAVMIIVLTAVKDGRVKNSVSAENSNLLESGEVPLTVRYAMNLHSPCIPSSASMREAVLMMDEQDLGGMPVVDEGMHVVGFVSDADVARFMGSNDVALFDSSSNLFRFVDDGNMAARVAELMEKNVMNIAVKNVVCVSPEDPLDYACRLMAEQRFKKLPVVEDGRYIGSLSRRNVVSRIAKFALGETKA